MLLQLYHADAVLRERKKGRNGFRGRTLDLTVPDSITAAIQFKDQPGPAWMVEARHDRKA